MPGDVRTTRSSRLAARVRAVPPSGIRRFFDLIQTMDGVISLGVGEPDFTTPWHIREAAIYSLERGMTMEFIDAQIARLPLTVVPYDHAAAKLTATLKAVTRSHGVSLADRACLALGMDRNLPVVTGDRVDVHFSDDGSGGGAHAWALLVDEGWRFGFAFGLSFSTR